MTMSNNAETPKACIKAEQKPNVDNPCAFMSMPRCMRQDVSKRLSFDICQACISGRMEGHLFALREEIHKLISGNRR